MLGERRVTTSDEKKAVSPLSAKAQHSTLSLMRKSTVIAKRCFHGIWRSPCDTRLNILLQLQADWQ